MRARKAMVFLLLIGGIAFGQDAPKRLEFEVASVKPTAPSPDGRNFILARGGPGTQDPGQVTYTGFPLQLIITNAFGIKPYQMSGPGWLNMERYDITAKIPEGTTKEQFNVMLQNLLADRFGMKIHHETKELPGYELSVAKNGPKLKAAVEDPNAPANLPPPGGRGEAGRPPGPPPIGKDGRPQLPPGRKGMMMMMRPGRATMMARVQSVSALADMLGNQLGTPVVDKTGLTGTYDYDLEFMPEPGGTLGGGGLPPLPPPPPGATPPPSATAGVDPPADQGEAPSLMNAVQEQLGLKLEKKKTSLDFIVIDHIEKVPTEN